MKTFVLTLIVLLGVNLLFCEVANAQFEQKFTLQLAGGYVRAIAPDNFTNVFENGFSVDAGAQYNFSRTTSMVVLVKYSKYFANDNTILGALDAKFNLLGISLCPKYRFNPSSKINPYVYGGVSLNYVSYSISGGYVSSNTSPASFGVTGGLGIDFGISDNLAFFWQAGANTIKPKGDWLSAIYTQAGLNISLFKSKSL
jgi:opacity protein-like surface antigen